METWPWTMLQSMLRNLIAAASVYTPHASPPGVSRSPSSTSSSGWTGSVTMYIVPPPLPSSCSPASMHLRRYGCFIVRSRRSAFFASASSASDFLFFSSYRNTEIGPTPSFLPVCSFHGLLPLKEVTSGPTSNGTVYACSQ